MTTRATYRVEVTRSQNWWAIEVPELPGTFSQARRLHQVETLAREAISMMTDLADDGFNIDVHIEPEPDVAELLAALKASIETADAADAVAKAARARAVAELHDRGLPNRDVGTLTGLSHQRVAQILNA